jgi:hypothetical protein
MGSYRVVLMSERRPTGRVIGPWVGWKSDGAVVEVEGPLEGGVAGGADKSGGLESRGHAVWRVNEGAEGVLAQAIPGVFQGDGGVNVPSVARISERDHAARTGSRSPEERLHIRITTDDAVESDDISIGHGVSGHTEVPEDELSGARGIARGEVATCCLEVGCGRVREGDVGQASTGELHGDRANASADIEKVQALEWPAA